MYSTDVTAKLQARAADKCADGFRTELCGGTYGRRDLFPIGKAVAVIKQTPPPRDCASCDCASYLRVRYSTVTNNGKGSEGGLAGPSRI
jgi:hypothetical protein